jgi:hypothetical protein
MKKGPPGPFAKEINQQAMPVNKPYHARAEKSPAKTTH